MRVIVARPFKSIDSELAPDVELSPFSIITGTNGAGKSNLLEGLQANALYFDDLKLSNEQVRLFRLGELLAATEEPVQGVQYKEPWANLYNNVLMWQRQVRTQPGMGANDAERERWLEHTVLESRLLTKLALDRIRVDSGKTLLKMNEADFKAHAPLIAGVKDPFTASIAEVFLSYAQRRTANEHAQWKLATKNVGSALTDEEFVSRFGPAPWEALNDLLRLVGLEYSFAEPTDSETTLYEVGITHKDGTSLKPEDLSSGEKVLLVVALSLFAGSQLNEAIELPKLLLLDEADASLHPSMIKSLLTVLEEIFVKQYGVRVLLTTHSPTTVALAPPDSLFVMRRDSPRLARASTDEAMKLLTVGMTTLSVRLENRRQIFVESEYDQAVYQTLFGVLRKDLKTARSAEFVAAAIGNSGGGCDEVKRLVRQLRDSGNNQVCGIVDRDARGGTPAWVYTAPDRYSIENVVLDPLIFGAFLLREGVMSWSDLDLPHPVRHFELNKGHGVLLAGALARKFGFGTATIVSRYHGGFEVEVAEEFLELPGHDLQNRLVSTLPALNAYRKDLLRSIAARAALDVPHFIPRSVVELFEAVLAD